MTVRSAATDDVASGLPEARPLTPVEQRRGEEKGRANLACKRGGQLVAPQIFRGDTRGVGIEILDSRAERRRDLEHVAHVADPRQVVERHRLVGQKTRGDEGKCFVLIPCRCDLTA